MSSTTCCDKYVALSSARPEYALKKNYDQCNNYKYSTTAEHLNAASTEECTTVNSEVNTCFPDIRYFLFPRYYSSI